MAACLLLLLLCTLHLGRKGHPVGRDALDKEAEDVRREAASASVSGGCMCLFLFLRTWMWTWMWSGGGVGEEALERRGGGGA